jgi:MYXO-CTERM domain-containing protein
VPTPAGTDPDGECIDSASDPGGKCGGLCDGHARCLYPAAGTSCGTCKACNGASLCNITPDDDDACGTIDCDQLDTSCLDYHDITSRRCGALGACKAANAVATCSDVTNMCTVDGGDGAAGGDDATTGGGTDAGLVKHGGGGCGCTLGDPNAGGTFAWLLTLPVLGGILTTRRRRR